MKIFNNMKVGTKLMGMFILTAFIPITVIGWLSAGKAKESLIAKSYAQLETVRQIKKDQILAFFDESRVDMVGLVNTVEKFRDSAFEKLRISQQLKMARIRAYLNRIAADITNLSKNEDVLGLFHKLRQYHDDTGVGPKDAYGVADDRYLSIHGEYGRIMSEFVKTYGYSDVYLICEAHGHVMFSSAKQNDLGTNLAHGPFREEGLARLWRTMKETRSMAVEDFSAYSPNNGHQTAFSGAPIYDETGQMVGMVALRIETAGINRIFQNRDGMGKTGETYLVGKTGDRVSFRSDLQTMGEGKYVIGYDISDRRTSYIDTALSGKSGNDVYTDSAGKLVIIAYDPLRVHGLNWVCISKIDLEEAIVQENESNQNEISDNYFQAHAKDYGYGDLYLIHPEGEIFFSVKRASDYRTNLLNGKHSDSGLGRLFKKIGESRAFGMEDFSPYEPGGNKPVSFIARPIVHNGQIELVIAAQLSLDEINAIMQKRDGMGRTGGTYLVGPDKRMRSDSVLDPENRSVEASFAGTVEENGIDSAASDNALAGKTGMETITDYRGESVLSAFAPVDVFGTTWALLAEIDEAEVMQPVNTLVLYVLIAVAIVSLAGLAIAIYITRGIRNQLGGEPFEIANIARHVSEGNLDLEFKSGELKGVQGAMQKMVGNLRDTVHTAGKIADGDLTVKVNLLSERDALGHALTAMVKKLSDIVSEINLSSEQVLSGAEQISSSSQEMSRGTTEQAASLEEITSSMSQIASQTRQNAENAGQANRLANEARNFAENGSRQMNGMVSAVTEINDSSRNISKIIKIIDEIAFQTNLLALNAAVEAARAGRRGKGFAVVAGEVRNLAARSARAAKETADLIEGSVKKAEEGKEIADKTADALKQIVSSVSKMADLVGEIAVASNEQAQGVAQTTDALGQIDQVVQQYTAQAEESAAAAEELSGQSMFLKDLLGAFKTAGNENGAAGKPSPIPARGNASAHDFGKVEKKVGNKPAKTEVPVAVSKSAIRPEESVDTEYDPSDFEDF